MELPSNVTTLPLSKASEIVLPEVRDKVRSLGELAHICEQLRSDGKRIVLCHGVFDLVHLGHVRHLGEARQYGDVLVVTVTADQFVHKGPGRPVFNEGLRAEMLAALAYVNWVAINHAPDAIPVIESIRPDTYVKGPDYAVANNDVTGKISAEREAVHAHGGELIVTDDITFSSSSLINQHLNVFDPAIREHLNTLRSDGGLGSMLELLAQIEDYRVLLVGDCIIDEYNYVTQLGKSAKEPIIATCHQGTEVFAGGVVAAAKHLSSFVREVEIVTCLGTTDNYAEFLQESLPPNVHMTTVSREDAPTTRKVRFVDPTYTRKLFEVYHFIDTPLMAHEQASMDSLIAERAGNSDLVIVTDFGHGLIAPSTVDVLTSKSKFLAVNTQANSGNMGFNLITKYSRTDYICIDAPEARLATQDKFTDLAEIASDKLPAMVSCPKIILTHGKNGCVAYESGQPAITIPAITKTVVDTVGAGDAFLAVTAPLVASGAPLSKVGFVGNVAGALKVGIVGHRKSVEKVNLIKTITALLK